MLGLFIDGTIERGRENEEFTLALKCMRFQKSEERGKMNEKKFS